MSGFLKNENCEMAKLCDVFIWLGKFDFELCVQENKANAKLAFAE